MHNCLSPVEWHSHANSNISMAYSTQAAAMKQMDLSRKANQDAFSESLAMCNDLNNQLEDKVKACCRLIEKLNNKVKSVEASIVGLKESHQHLLRALREKEPPLSLCAWRMEQREKRPLREHVRDDVEIALEEERAVLIDSQKMLGDASKLAIRMVASLEGKRDELMQNIEQKSQALAVDELCLRNTQRSFNSQLSPRSCTPLSSRSSKAASSGLPSPSARKNGIDSRAIDNEVTCQQESRLHSSARSREEAAKDMREDIAKLIARCEKLHVEAAAKTERSLQERIHEMQLMKKRIETEARETKKKEEHTKTTIAETRSQISSLEEPMALWASHSSWRRQASSKERGLDPAEISLEEQKRQLMRTTEELRKHRQVEKSILTDLQEQMDRLKEDLRDKTAAINIDMNCLTHQNEMMSPLLADPQARARYVKLMTKQHGAGSRRPILPSRR